MNLLVENGLLLKAYALAFDTERGRHLDAPLGWTPDRDEWVEAKATEIQEKAVVAGNPVPREIAYVEAERLAGERLVEARQPLRGWVPAKPSTDKKLIRAWLALIRKLDDWPEDGRYVWRGGGIVKGGE